MVRSHACKLLFAPTYQQPLIHMQAACLQQVDESQREKYQRMETENKALKMQVDISTKQLRELEIECKSTSSNTAGLQRKLQRLLQDKEEVEALQRQRVATIEQLLLVQHESQRKLYYSKAHTPGIAQKNEIGGRDGDRLMGTRGRVLLLPCDQQSSEAVERTGVDRDCAVETSETCESQGWL